MLRDYQQKALEDLWVYFSGAEGNPVCIIPTGGGKSHVIAELTKRALEYPGVRVLMVTHQKELIQQNARKMLQHQPNIDMSIWSASMGQRSARGRVVCAGVQSIYRRGASELGVFDLVIIDECHLVSHKQEGMYRVLIDNLSEANPNLRVIGFTATAFRTGHGDITMPGIPGARDPVFTDIAHETKMRELIDWGYLSPLRSKRTAFEIDVSSVPIARGDFAARELEALVDRARVTEAALDEVQRYARDRLSWLCFCAGVGHAHHVTAAMQERDIDAWCVTGGTPKDERAEILDSFVRGEIRCVVNANLLTTGFDAPNIDLIVMLAPTMSRVRYVQMMGRGMRIADGKTDCMILDFARNISRLGPVDSIKPWSPNTRENRGDAPVKACPECQEIVSANALTCPDCGYQWPAVERERVRHGGTASDAEPLSDNTPPEMVSVDSVSYYKHMKRDDPGAAPTLRVEYQCGFSVFREWIPIEHTGFARERAMRWWMARAPGEAPQTVDDALALSERLRVPDAIKVDMSGRFPTIVSHRLSTTTTRETA